MLPVTVNPAGKARPVLLARAPRLAVVRSDQSKVEHPHVTVRVDHRVARLEVAMDEPELVGGGEASARVDARLHDPPPARALAKPLGEAHSLEQRHHDEDRDAAGLSLVRADVEHLDDVGVLDSRHRLRFASHPLHPPGSGALLRAQQLDGDFARELGIPRAVHDTHTTHAEPLAQLVAPDLLPARRAAEQRAAEVRQQIADLHRVCVGFTEQPRSGVDRLVGGSVVHEPPIVAVVATQPPCRR